MTAQDDASRAREALAYVSPSCGREDWFRILASVKSLLGEDGKDIADEWSQGDPDAYDAASFRSTWKSIDANVNGGIGAGTLFAIAKEGGYVQKMNGHPVVLTAEDHAKREAAQRKADEEREARARRAVEKSQAVWDKAAPVNAHPYLDRKGVKPTATMRVIGAGDLARILGYEPQSDGEKLAGSILCLPIVVSGALSSLEFIDEAGRKSALAGGRKQSGYWATGKLPEDAENVTLYLGEGAATVMSVVKAMGGIGAASFSAGNLPAAALALRTRLPHAKFIVLADVGNGEDKAHEAAGAVDGLVALPDFGENRPEGWKDFNDLHAHCGLEAVRKALGAAQPPGKLSEAQPTQGKRSAAVVEARPKYRRYSEITAKPINWLWAPRIARGKLTIIAGNPGLGKSQVTCCLGATVSTGGNWPDGKRCERGSVIYLSAEDDPEDTIKPRLLAAGADVARCYNFDAVIEGFSADGSERRHSFNFQRDLATLEKMIVQIGDVALAVVDPISAYLGEANSHNNAEVRALLAPLSEMAAKYGIAIIAVSHLNKGGSPEAIMRVTGSLAFVAAARAGFVVVQDKEDETRRYFLPLKNNIGPGGSATGLAFKIETATVPSETGPISSSRIAWEADPVSITADEAMAAPLDAEERSDLDDAVEFLSTILKQGAMPSKQIQAEATGAGHSWATIRRAQRALKIKPTKGGMKEGWLWALPLEPEAPKMLNHTEGAQPAGLSNLGASSQVQPKADDDAEIL